MDHPCLLGILLMAGIGLLASGCGSALAVQGTSRGVFWHEGEDFKAAPNTVGSPIQEKAPASGGKGLSGAAFPNAGSLVQYELDLPEGIEQAKIVFRYARLHWRDTMVPARLAVELSDASGGILKGDAILPDTKGWGGRPADWQLATVMLGDVKAGKATLKLIGTGDDNDVTIDGFFIAPERFVVSGEELALTRVAITSEGYLGLRSATTLRQDVDRSLLVAGCLFEERIAIGLRARVVTEVRFNIRNEQRGGLSSAGQAQWRGENNVMVARFSLPDLPDGSYTFEAESVAPKAKVAATVILAGQFLATLDERVADLEAFTAELAKSTKPVDVECLPDFEHVIAYLKTNGKRLSETAASGGDAFKQGLAAKEGITNPAPVVNGMRNSLAQAEETMRRLKAGHDPYAGRTGDLRRAYRSAVSGDMQVYRAYVPSGYDKADKVPLLLMLHGGGGDENYYPDMDGGAIEQTLDRRGYMAVCPKWHSRRNPNCLADLKQLVDLTCKRYTKIDPQRIYCTGVSMGGFGTYNMAVTYPELFAAICCVSGTGDPAKADRLKNVPTLILQGGADEVVPPAGARKMEARMKELGQTVELHVFPTYGHDYKSTEYLNLSLDFFER